MLQDVIAELEVPVCWFEYEPTSVIQVSPTSDVTPCCARLLQSVFMPKTWLIAAGTFARVVLLQQPETRAFDPGNNGMELKTSREA